MPYRVSNFFVSAIVQNKGIPELVLAVKGKISFTRKNNDFIFVYNSNISNIHLFDDRLHLAVELGSCVIANNVIDRIHNYIIHPPNMHIHTIER